MSVIDCLADSTKSIHQHEEWKGTEVSNTVTDEGKTQVLIKPPHPLPRWVPKFISTPRALGQTPKEVLMTRPQGPSAEVREGRNGR